METLTTIARLRSRLAPLRRAGRTIGFVPTMGYLHEGHLALMRRAMAENDVAVASIFVNPLQFGPAEDYDRYPRDLDRDRAILDRAGIDFLFAPPPAEMYPAPMRTHVEVPRLGRMLEGEVRPDYFRGVATVVTKLFNVVGPDRAYFGEKDYQQVLLIRQMARDLSMPVEVVPVETIREPDGVACSSRNVYLDPAQRSAAVRLPRALAEARRRIASGERDPGALEAHLRAFIEAEPLARPEVVVIRDADTLEPIGGAWPDRVLVLLFVRFGSTQLLDQAVVEVPRP